MKDKNKVIISVILGLVCFTLTMVLFLQFKTISQTDITLIERMREDELQEEIANYKTKNDEVITKLEETNTKIKEYKESILTENESTGIVNKEVQQLNNLIGKNDVQGEGVIITLTDTKEAKISARDLIILLNDLKQAGAEAISINDQRIVYNSYVVDIEHTFISVNGRRIVSPYVVKAIGNTKYLESALSQKQYGYIDKMTASDKNVTLEKDSFINIIKYSGDLNFEYVEGDKK